MYQHGRKKTVLFLIWTVVACKLTEATGSHCWKHCVTYDQGNGGDGGGHQDTGPRPTPSHQGPPGKRGSPGPKGGPGIKGEKGDCSSDREVTNRIERQINVLNKTNEEKFEDLSRQLTERILRLETKLQESNEVIQVLRGAKVLKSCQEVKTKMNTTMINGYFLIRPDFSLPAFPVHCSFNQDGSVVTTMEHDSENEMEALPGCEPVQCYNHNIRYRASFQQIAAVVSTAARCQQFIKWRCQGSTLLNSNFGGWKSSDGTARAYWGGSDGREGFCACGVQGNCVDPAKNCNCDINAGPFYVDEGYIQNKDHLPVASVQFGDLGDSGERGFHSIGPLQCFN